MRPLRATTALLSAVLLVPGVPGSVTAHTAGRVEVTHGAVQYSWPSVYFEGRFRGTGVGVVLNDPAADYRTYYDRALLAVDGDVWRRPPSWRPQVVVIGLGINDFSTPINVGEPWTPETLRAAYDAAYLGFIDKLRARYGPRTTIVVSATYAYGTTAFAEAAQQIVEERNSQGDTRVHYWYYDSAGLDYTGCDWHPSAHDHELIAARLLDYLTALHLRW